MGVTSEDQKSMSDAILESKSADLVAVCMEKSHKHRSVFKMSWPTGRLTSRRADWSGLEISPVSEWSCCNTQYMLNQTYAVEE